MITIEVIINMSMIAVGPFDNQRQAMDWISELVAANPNEKAVIKVNETSQTTIRVYVSGCSDEENCQDALPELRFSR